MREDHPAPEYSIVLRLTPPMALFAACRTARTSFTSWADVLDESTRRPRRTRQAWRPALLAEVMNQVEVLVVLIADVLEELGVRLIGQRLRDAPRLRVRLRVVDRHLDVHVAEILADEALGHAQLVGVGLAGVVEPSFVVETDGLDDQRVAIPVSDGIT